MYRHPLPSQVTKTFGITVFLTQPHLVSVVRSTILMFIGNVADWQLVKGRGGGGILQTIPQQAREKCEKNMKSWLENSNENIVPTLTYTSFGLIPLSLEVCLQKIFPPKWKRKKRGGGGGGARKPKSQGVTFKPPNKRFFLLSMHERQKLFVRTTDRAVLDWYTRSWAVLVVLTRWSETGLTTCSQSNGVLF